MKISSPYGFLVSLTSKWWNRVTGDMVSLYSMYGPVCRPDFPVCIELWGNPMIIWPLRLGIKLPEQNIRFLRDCHYGALLPMAVEWTDMHRLKSLAGCTARFYFEHFSESLLTNKRHTVWFEIKCLCQKGNPITSQVLLSPLHLTRLVVSSCGTRKHFTDTIVIPGTTPTVTSVNMQNQEMEQPINFFMPPTRWIAEHKLLLLICYIWMFFQFHWSLKIIMKKNNLNFINYLPTQLHWFTYKCNCVPENSLDCCFLLLRFIQARQFILDK